MSVKGFIANVFDLFKQWFSVAEKFVQDHIHVAVVVTENIKNFIENPVGDFLLTVVDEKVPGDLSGKVKEILPKVLLGLHIIDDCKELNEEDTLKCISEKLQASSDDFKNVFFHSLAVQLAEKLSDGHITFSDAIALVEWYYRYKVKQTN